MSRKNGNSNTDNYHSGEVCVFKSSRELCGLACAGKRLWELGSPDVEWNCLLVGQDVILAGGADDETYEWNVPEPRGTVQTAEPRGKFFQPDDKTEHVTRMLVR
jgi:hypothetical protein